MAKNEKQIILTYVGRDSWSRPVYIHEGVYWVDVEPRKDHKPMLCTKMHNQFDGEPNNHMQEGIEVIFEPACDTWD